MFWMKNKHQAQQDGQFLQEEKNNLLINGNNFFIREAYKTLRTNVSFALADQEGCKVIAVTSSMQSEGKSFTATNLAIACAQADKKVLLIDADLRRPKLNRLLGASARNGLTELLLQPDLREQVILHEETSGMDVIISGAIPPNPSELLGSKRMKTLLDDLRQKYEYIILDTPPVNMVTDASVLAPICDGVIFVVRMNHSERGAVIHAVEQLGYANAKILGMVLNEIDMEQTVGYRYQKYHRYGRYGYSGYYGYSGQHESKSRSKSKKATTEGGLRATGG
jgi:capsular exopolysaccharide synthesis family protein